MLNNKCSFIVGIFIGMIFAIVVFNNLQISESGFFLIKNLSHYQNFFISIISGLISGLISSFLTDMIIFVVINNK